MSTMRTCMHELCTLSVCHIRGVSDGLRAIASAPVWEDEGLEADSYSFLQPVADGISAG